MLSRLLSVTLVKSNLMRRLSFFIISLTIKAPSNSITVGAVLFKKLFIYISPVTLLIMYIKVPYNPSCKLPPKVELQKPLDLLYSSSG